MKHVPTAQWWVALPLLLFTVLPGYAMEISEIRSPQPIESRTIILKGEILRGDLSKLSAEILRVPIFIEEVSLDSPGGDVLEAIRIGRLLRTLSVSVVARQCNSACVLIWVAAVKRLAAGDLGLHRPSFDKHYFSGLSRAQSELKYNDLIKQVEGYLREMLVPQEAIELILQTNSADIVRVGESSNIRLYAKLVATAPAFDEWILSKCGRYPVDAGKQLEKMLHGRSTLSKTEQDAIIEKYFVYRNCRRGAEVDAFAEGLEKVRRPRI